MLLRENAHLSVRSAHLQQQLFQHGITDLSYSLIDSGKSSAVLGYCRLLKELNVWLHIELNYIVLKIERKIRHLHRSAVVWSFDASDAKYLFVIVQLKSSSWQNIWVMICYCKNPGLHSKCSRAYVPVPRVLYYQI